MKSQDNLSICRGKPFVYEEENVKVKIFHPNTHFLSAASQYIGWRKREFCETVKDSPSEEG